MACQRYHGWMTDAALGALGPAREAAFRTHVLACAECRAELERRRMLVVAIDRGVAAGAAAEPSPALAARVRQRIAEEAASAPWRITSWLPVAAGALAVVALVSIWLLRREPARQLRVASHGAVASPAKPALPAVPPSQPQVVSVNPSLAAPLRSRRRATSIGAPSAIAPEPEVLVPAEEWRGVVSLYNAMQSGRVDGTVLVASAKNVDKPLAMDKLKIAPLEIPKLDKDEGDN